jgi:hypothetical protein
MIKQLQELMLQSQFNNLREILTNKGSDYAKELDVFKNFRDTAQVLGIKPEKVILVFMQTKINRLVNLWDGKKTPNYETVADTITDLQAYSLLLGQLSTETFDLKNEKNASGTDSN